MVDLVLLQSPENQLVQPAMYPTSLSLLYLAAALERAGAKVVVIDLRDKKLAEVDMDAIPPAGFYGVTATTPEYSSGLALARLLKAKYPGSQTIIGGAHATALPQECLRDGWDVVAVGEWDHTIVQLFNKGHPGGIVSGGPIADLDALPFPARHLAGERAWSTTLMPGEGHGEGEKAAMIISSRGCPYSCSFCASARTLPVRFRSPENVAAEVRQLVQQYRVRAFRDESDNLMANREWFLRLCDLLVPLGVRWKGHSRSAHVTDELLQAAGWAGMVEMGLGVESGDPQVLAAVGKGETVEEHARAVALLKKHGIISKVYLMSGLPGETERSLALTADFFKKAKPDKWTCALYQPLPGSGIWAHPERYGATINRGNLSSRWFFMGEVNVEYEGTPKEAIADRYRRLCEYLRGEQWRRARHENRCEV